MIKGNPLDKLGTIMDEMYAAGWGEDFGEVVYANPDDHKEIMVDFGSRSRMACGSMLADTMPYGYTNFTFKTSCGRFSIVASHEVERGDIKLQDNILEKYKNYLFEREVLG